MSTKNTKKTVKKPYKIFEKKDNPIDHKESLKKISKLLYGQVKGID